MTKRMATEKQHPRPAWPLRLLRAALRLSLPLGTLGALVLVGVVAIPQISQQGFPVERIEMAGDLDKVDRQQVEQVALQHLQDGLLGSDLSQLRQAIAAMDWVADVNSQRIWPSTVRLTIREQRPVALWKKTSREVTGETNSERLLLDDGRLVTMPANGETFDVLPTVLGEGVEGQQVVAELAQLYSVLAGQVRASGQASYEWRLKTIAVAAYGGRSVLLETGEAGTPQNNELLLKLPRQETYGVLQRFVQHADAIFTQRLASHIERAPAVVDLRYQNGFAVRWRSLGGASSSDDARLQERL